MSNDLFDTAEAILARNKPATEPVQYEGRGNTLGDSLRKGWSSGVDSLGANVNQIVGLGAEAAGADNFAQGRYRAAQGLREEAQHNAPQVNSLGQVDGVGNALRWGAGQIGAMGPTALGVVGGTVATGNPFVGGALAMGLPEAGDIAYRQTLDPQTMEQGAGTRLTKALAGGAASGAVQAAGPGLLMGKVAKGAGAGLVKQSTGQIIGRNFAEGVGVNAAAEGGSEAIKQFAANPDASFNMGAIGESALAGGVLGVPFGALGAGVDVAKASPGKAWIGAKNTAQQGVENARGALNGVGEALGSTGEALAPAWEAVKGHVDAGMTAAQTGAQDAWAAMPDGLKGVGEFVKTGVEDQIASARTAYKNIMADDNVPTALKEQAQEWGSNLASTANRAYLWSADKVRGVGVGEKAKAAVPEDVVGRLREFSKPAGDMLDTILNSESMADTREFTGKTLDQAKEVLKGRKEQAAKWLGPKMDELMGRADVSDERKQQIADLRSNISDTEAQAKAATILKAQSLADAAKPKLDATYKKVGDAFSKLFPEDPSVKKSDDHSGMNALIFDKIGPMIKEAKPELLEDADSTMKLGSTLRKFMTAAAEGKDLRAAGIHTEMVDLLGPDLAHDVLNAAHEFATGGDQTKQANYFKHLTDSVKEKASMDNLETVITKSLSNEASGRTGVTDNPRELAKYLRSWARGEFAAGKPKERVEFEDQEVHKFLEAHFGANAKKVLDALQKDVEGERGKQKAGIGEEGGMDFESTGEYDTNVSYHGAEEIGDTPKLYESDRSDRSVKNDGGGGQYGSAVEQAIKKLKAEHPDMNVSFVKLADYAKAHNLNEEQIARLAEGKDPSQHGFIKKERIKNDDGLEEYQLRGMRGKIKSDKHPDAIGVEGRSENYAYDSRRIANVMRKAAGTERSDFEVTHGFRGQLAQKFAEGIAKLTQHEGRNLKVRDDHVIGKVGGKDLTWGEARNLLADKPLLRTEADKASDAHRDTVERLRKYAEATAKDRKASRDEQKAAWRDYYNAERKGDFKRDVELTSEGRTADLESRLSKALMKRDEEMRDYGITSVDDPAISEHQAKVDQLRDKLNDAKFEDWYSSEDGVNAREGRRESSPTEDVVQRAGKDHGQNDMERANYNPAADNTMRDKPLFSPIDGTITDSGKDVLRMKLDRMKSSVVVSTRELAPKIEALMKVSDSLDEAERKTLGAAVYADAKNIKALSAMIGDMHDKYVQYAETTAKYGKGQEFGSPESPLLYGPQDLADRTAKYSGKGMGGQPKTSESLKATLDKHAEYIDNPPEDFSIDRVKTIAEWAERQEARLKEAAAKLEEKGGDEFERLEGMYFDAMFLKEHAREMIQNDKDMAEADKANGTNLFGGNPDPKQVAAKKAAFLERAVSGDKALIKELSTSTDAKGLQRAVEALYDVVGADDALQAANKRLSELVQDPSTAYGLQTKKYSLISSAIHAELERSGFAATHDSPIKHEGIFDWRAHRGKGEGNAAFGAGTYLSTAEGVHKSYKEQFTAVVNDDRDLHSAVSNAQRKVYAAQEELTTAQDKKSEGEDWLGFMEDSGFDSDEGSYSDAPSYTPEQIAGVRSDIKKYESKISDAQKTLEQAESSLEEAESKLKEHRAKKQKSPTYEVSVDIKPEQLLDWNALLSEQGELVRNAFEKAGFVDNEAKIQKALQRYIDAEYDLQAIKKDEQAERKVRAAKDAEYYDSHPFETVEDPSDITLRWAKKKNVANEKIKATHLEWRLIKEQVSSHVFTGGQLYAKLSEHLGSQAAASDYLQSLGVLGHRFASSGGRNDAHPNYVIYDDSKITTNYVHFDAQKSAGTPLTAKGRAQILAYLNTVAPWVQAEFPFLSHAGEFTKEFGQAIVRVSTHALNPTSVAYHESLHAFFQHLKENSGKDISQVVMDAASSPAVTSQLRTLLAHSPEALKQLGNAEERAAYMYQFWADGKLTLAEKPTTLFQKITAAFRKVLGIWSNDERALHIMEYFHSGEYAQNVGKQSAVRAALMEKGHNTAVGKMQEMGSKFMEVGDALWGAGSARLRDSKSGALHELADLMKRKGTDVGEDRGYIPAARLKRTELITQLAEGLAGADETVMHEALEALQGGTKPTSLEARKAYASVRKVLDDMFDYLHQSGVDTGDLGYGKDYFPRHWDSNYLSKHEAEFMDMARKYPQWADAKDTYNKLLANDGSELRVVDRPGMQANKKRVLSFIKDADAAPFMSKNLPEIMNGYITQATRRGEWARRFGDDNAKMGDLLVRASKEGATKAEIAHAQDFVAGVNGTLGDTLNPTLRRYMGNMIVYQNIRLLPLAIFSSVVDPMGVMVRGGTVGDAWSTFKRGIREVPAGLKGQQITDHWTDMAQALGTIDNASLQHALGSLYTQGMVGGTAKKINDTFFKYNLMEQFNQSMRVGATEAAVGFITKHADGKASQHSIRWIAELGLRGGDVKVSNGRMATNVAEGLTEAQAARVKSAVNQWVDGAVLRPDAADKPTWMNDPHFMLVSHLKQFVYSFHHTILDRVMHEMRHQNYAPAIALSSYVPIMIAADMLKGLIQGGGSEPDWKKAWGPGEYLGNGIERAGLFGVGQFGVDALQGNFGSLAGPTLGQMADGFEVLDGVKQFKPFAIHSLPANQLYAGALRAGEADPKFAE